MNGREIWFFSDIDEKNKMDKKPFFTFDLQSCDERQVEDLARFQKQCFDVDSILDAASAMRYVKAAAGYLARQLTDPDDDFIRHVGRQIHEGSLTKAVVEQLRPAIQAALDEVVRNRIQERLNVTFGKESAEERRPPEPEAEKPEIVTTEEEVQAFMIVRAIGSRAVPLTRITMRDARSYCSVFLDDNNRKPICRFYFNAKSQRTIGLFDAQKVESRVQINDPADLYVHAEQILAAIAAHA